MEISERIDLKRMIHSVENMSTKQHTVSVGFRIPSDAAMGLRMIASQNGMSVSDILRIAFVEWLERRAQTQGIITSQKRAA